MGSEFLSLCMSPTLHLTSWSCLGLHPASFVPCDSKKMQSLLSVRLLRPWAVPGAGPGMLEGLGVTKSAAAYKGLPSKTILSSLCLAPTTH